MPLRNTAPEDLHDLAHGFDAHDYGIDRKAAICEQSAPRENAHFDVYCAEWVSFTSTQSGGGDWHWRLISAGRVLLDCGGYKSRSACISAVNTLRREACTAEFPQ